MKPLIVANWKMNPQAPDEAKRIFNYIKISVKDSEVIICPPFVYLPVLNSLISARKKNGGGGIKLGAQNCFWEEIGAFTGEISPSMIKGIGCRYVILGHSERRRYFNETDEMINKKLTAALEAGIRPILCVGETLEQKERGEGPAVLRTQIENGLRGISKKDMPKISIAYEPMWAIGTGKSCGIEDAIVMSLVIRKIAAQKYSRSVSDKIMVLYGGSVNSKNAASYIKEAKMNGLLVGGASLDPKEFLKIIKEAK